MRYEFVKITEDSVTPWFARLRVIVKDFEVIGPTLAIIETLEVIPMEELDRTSVLKHEVTTLCF
jgi:hypothetical protein